MVQKSIKLILRMLAIRIEKNYVSIWKDLGFNVYKKLRKKWKIKFFTLAPEFDFKMSGFWLFYDSSMHNGKNFSSDTTFSLAVSF